MVKIATQINDYDDILILFNLQDFLNKKSIRSTVLGMGPKAHLIRILSPLRNEFTYTFLDGTAPAAEGQIPMSMYKLTEHVRVKKSEQQASKQQGLPAPGSPLPAFPRIYGIIGGDQIAKSKSPLIHNGFFHKKKINAIYSSFPTDNFKKTMKFLRTIGIAGLSVTAPFKREAYKYATEKDSISKKLGVANTLVFPPLPSLPPSPLAPLPRGEGKCTYHKSQCECPPSPSGRRGRGMREVNAFNTDVFGILDGYPELQKCRSIAILGAGGAVPAVIEAIYKGNPQAEIMVYARDTKKSQKELAPSFTTDFNERKAMPQILPLQAVVTSHPDAIICAVSSDIQLPFPSANSQQSTVNSQQLLAIDLRYGSVTKFMAAATEKGYRVFDGERMLVKQAEKQFGHFVG